MTQDTGKKIIRLRHNHGIANWIEIICGLLFPVLRQQDEQVPTCSLNRCTFNHTQLAMVATAFTFYPRLRLSLHVRNYSCSLTSYLWSCLLLCRRDPQPLLPWSSSPLRPDLWDRSFPSEPAGAARNNTQPASEGGQKLYNNKYGKIMGIYGTSAKTPFVLTPFGSRWRIGRPRFPGKLRTRKCAGLQVGRGSRNPEL